METDKFGLVGKLGASALSRGMTRMPYTPVNDLKTPDTAKKLANFRDLAMFVGGLWLINR